MLDFVLCCALFTCGIIAACVDWNKLMVHLTHFDSQVKVITKVINEQGVTNEQTVWVENTFNPWVFIFIMVGLTLLYFFIIYMPATILFNHLEKKYQPLIARFGLKRITYRKETKRRGSWPLAYSN